MIVQKYSFLQWICHDTDSFILKIFRTATVFLGKTVLTLKFWLDWNCVGEKKSQLTLTGFIENGLRNKIC
jgi:hypothetical protein